MDYWRVLWWDGVSQVHACMLSLFGCVQLFVTSGTLALQAPLFLGFSRQECWSEMPCPPPGDLPDPGTEPSSHVSCIGRWLNGKEFTCSVGDACLICELGRSSVEGSGNPLQYSCLGNPKDRGAWWATLHGVTKSWTRLKWLSNTHALGLNKPQFNWEHEALCEQPRTEEALRCPLRWNSTGCMSLHPVH